MRHSSFNSTSAILTVAAIGGVLAFGYTLVTRAPRGGSGRGGWARGMMRAPDNRPNTIDGLQARVVDRPRDWVSWLDLAKLYDEADRPEDAQDAWRRAADLRVAFARSHPQEAQAWFDAGRAYARANMMEQAREPLERAEPLLSARVRDAAGLEATSETDWYNLGWTRKLLGQDVDAAIAWTRARDLLTPDDKIPTGFNTLYNLSCYRCLLGEKEEALEALELAIDAGWRDADHTEHDADFAAIKDDPRFKELVLRMKQAAMGVRIERGP